MTFLCMDYSMLSHIVLFMLACGDSSQEEVKSNKIKSTQREPASKSTAETATDKHPGESVYISACRQCHQAKGQGISELYPPLAGSDWLTKESHILIRIVLHGLQGPIKVNGQDYGATISMTARGSLDDQEIADVLSYIRTSWGNKQPEITTEEVKTVRAKYSSRNTPWTAAELEKE